MNVKKLNFQINEQENKGLYNQTINILIFQPKYCVHNAPSKERCCHVTSIILHTHFPLMVAKFKIQKCRCIKRIKDSCGIFCQQENSMRAVSLC